MSYSVRVHNIYMKENVFLKSRNTHNEEKERKTHKMFTSKLYYRLLEIEIYIILILFSLV